MKGSETEYKPVVIKGVDGGPDENPRFEKNINITLLCLRDITNKDSKDDLSRTISYNIMAMLLFLAKSALWKFFFTY